MKRATDARFDVNLSLRWRPAQRGVRLHVGADDLLHFVAEEYDAPVGLRPNVAVGSSL